VEEKVPVPDLRQGLFTLYLEGALKLGRGASVICHAEPHHRRHGDRFDSCPDTACNGVREFFFHIRMVCWCLKGTAARSYVELSFDTRMHLTLDQAKTGQHR
jgi:hypothetical protein